MSTKRTPEITFSDPMFYEAQDYMGDLRDDLQHIAKKERASEFGENALTEPGDMRLTVGMGLDNPMLTVETWYQTTGEFPGVLQYHSYSAEINVEGEDGVLRLDENRRHTITTRGYLFLVATSSFAVLNSMANPPREQ